MSGHLGPLHCKQILPIWGTSTQTIPHCCDAPVVCRKENQVPSCRPLTLWHCLQSCAAPERSEWKVWICLQDLIPTKRNNEHVQSSTVEHCQFQRLKQNGRRLRLALQGTRGLPCLALGWTVSWNEVSKHRQITVQKSDCMTQDSIYQLAEQSLTSKSEIG